MANNDLFSPPTPDEHKTVTGADMFAPPSDDESKMFAPPTSSLKDKLMQAAYYGTRPLDYLGGLARTGVAGGFQGGANLYSKLKSLATGENDDMPQVVTGEDALAALKGNAPPTAEYFKRAGVPEGGRLSDVAPFMFDKSPNAFRPTPGGSFDPSLRGAGGAAVDIALDPLTYLGTGALKKFLPAASISEGSKIASTLQNAAHNPIFLNPLEQGLKGAGKAIYKSAPTMKAVDQVGNQFGKDFTLVNGVEVPSTVSDELFNRGISGTGRQISDQAEAAATQLGQKRNSILKDADAAGGSVDMSAAMQPAEDMINKIRTTRDPQLLPLADSLEERIAKYKNLTAKPEIGPEAIVTPSQASGFKSSLYNDTGVGAWDTLRRTPQGAQANKALTRGLDQETSEAVERALPGQGEVLDQTNDAWGKLLTTKKVLEREARKGEGKNIFTSVDGMILPFAHEHPALIATKKAADFLKGNLSRTSIGRGTYNLGSTPLLDEVTRRALLNNQYQSPNNPSSWGSLQKGQ